MCDVVIGIGGFLFILGWIIYLMVEVPGFRYTILGIIALVIIVAVSICCCPQRKQRNRYPTSILPISAQQAGDASDIHNAPISNTLDSNTLDSNTLDSNAPNSDTPSVAQVLGRGESEVLQLPPPAVTRGSDRPASSALLPMFMDGKDG